MTILDGFWLYLGAIAAEVAVAGVAVILFTVVAFVIVSISEIRRRRR